MTYENIKQEVLALGFNESIEDESRFLLALNRAQSLLATDFPRQKVLLLSRTYVTPKTTYRSTNEGSIPLRRGEKVAFLYHRFDGDIYFLEKKLSLPYGCGSSFLEITEDGTLSTKGDGEAYAISVYGSETPSHLCEPNLPYVEYDISKYDTKARVISSLPTTVDGDPIEGVRVDGLTVRLPREYHGIFLVKYEKSPTSLNQFTSEVEIEERLFPLFSLLVCAYFWLDDEPERSQYYMALYREGRERTRSVRASYAEKIQTDAMGWT